MASTKLDKILENSNDESPSYNLSNDLSRTSERNITPMTEQKKSDHLDVMKEMQPYQ